MKRKNAFFAVVLFVPFAVAVSSPLRVLAGNLEPPGRPGPTMKTLDEIPPTWSQSLPASERFVQVLKDDFLVIGDEAILDKETGLVWEKSPSTQIYGWVGAVEHCTRLETGGRLGWHVPTLEQLNSLLDVSNTPALPTGHPFVLPDTDVNWTSTTHVSSPAENWVVRLSDRFMMGESRDTAGGLRVWCVRGGSN